MSCARSSERASTSCCSTCGLGEESGFDLLRDPAGPMPAVVVVTSYDYPQYADAALRLGAAGFVVKTAPTAELLEAIRRAAAGGLAFGVRPGHGVSLSEREREVLRCVVDGASNDEIGARLGISSRTVESHLRRLFDRLERRVPDRARRAGHPGGLARGDSLREPTPIFRRIGSLGEAHTAGSGSASIPSWISTTRSARSSNAGRGSRPRPLTPSVRTTVRSIAMIAWPVCESSCPVGSSARRSFGRLASARAIATRCCSPPDSSCGRWLRALAEPDQLQQLVDPRVAGARIRAHEAQRHLDVLGRRQDRHAARTPGR